MLLADEVFPFLGKVHSRSANKAVGRRSVGLEDVAEQLKIVLIHLS